ncbi:nuclear transport factor 2 family protein [Nocardia transvalensis]|uniref:nuclear transport factor 2 family protein n=1 Tax=Nocardia transvalensis TaxID=37333 RepID=UPI0018962443|nr:nuclear transport factor 2 family protein [Nocardia transvalensis]MBF6330491.1 nuclear transport factor 2 family protein [Nocardia transvalensis]
MTIAATASVDRVQVQELLSRYYGAIDDKRLDRALVDATFTVDGRLVNPTGTALVGREAITEQQLTVVTKFRATHHVITDHLIDFEGDTARLRANMTAMHLWAEDCSDAFALESHFLAGGVFEGQAARTADGWRLRELSLRITWRTGAVPVIATSPRVFG